MVIWSIPAKDDLKKIFEFVSRDSIYFANLIITTIIEKTENLNTFPEMGRIVPEISDNTIRELIIYSYRVIYEYTENDIIIHAVIHAKRDFDEVFKYPQK